MMKKPTRVGAIVAENPTLAGLINRARELQSIDSLVRSWLPPMLAPHVKVATLRDDTLVLSVKSAVWATRLRFECPNLVERARACDATRAVRQIKIRMEVEGDAS